MASTRADPTDRRPHRPGTMDSRGPRQNRESDSKTKAQPPKRPAAEVMAGDRSRAIMLYIVI